MASEVEICNLALSHIGDSATVASIDPPEGSAQAEHCASWYPVARNSLLEMHDWSFATMRAPLAELPNVATDWCHTYVRPNMALKVLGVTGLCLVGNQPYACESNEAGDQLILTNVANASIRYTRIVTNTSKFTPLFTDILGWYLSTYLAGPILKGDSAVKVANANMQVVLAMLAQAKLSDASQQQQRPLVHIAPWLAGR